MIHSLELDGNAFISTEPNCALAAILFLRQVTMRANLLKPTLGEFHRRNTHDVIKKSRELSNFDPPMISLLRF